MKIVMSFDNEDGISASEIVKCLRRKEYKSENISFFLSRSGLCTLLSGKNNDGGPVTLFSDGYQFNDGETIFTVYSAKK